MVSLAPLPVPVAMPRAVVSGTIADLALIFRPEVNLCVVHRRLPRALDGFVTQLLAGLESLEAELRLGAHEPVPPDRLLPASAQAMASVEAWLAEVDYLFGIFRDLFGTKAIGLRLRLLDKAMCPRFHVDNVPVRLVCTYGGLGTEWLPEAAVNRERLGHRSGGLPDHASGLMLDPDAVRRLPAGAIALLKGEKWPGNQGRGAVHRSPAPTPERPRRLLLTLDLR